MVPIAVAGLRQGFGHPLHMAFDEKVPQRTHKHRPRLGCEQRPDPRPPPQTVQGFCTKLSSDGKRPPNDNPVPYGNVHLHQNLTCPIHPHGGGGLAQASVLGCLPFGGGGGGGKYFFSAFGREFSGDVERGLCNAQRPGGLCDICGAGTAKPPNCSTTS